MFTEAPSVPQALLNLAIGIDVEVHAFGIRAFPVLAEEPAFRHLFQIVFVQEFATLSLLTQST